MALSPPKIVGPISPCSTTIRVEGQLKGATVTIVADSYTVVGELKAANGGQDDIAVQLGALTPGVNLRARQAHGGDVSALSKHFVPVQNAAQFSAIPPPTLMTPLFACGRCILVVGALPGALVRVRVEPGATIVGEAASLQGVAVVHLSEPLLAGQRLSISQVPCGQSETDGALSPPAAALSPHAVGALPAPVIDLPIERCLTALRIRNVVPGAAVRLKRSGEADYSGFFFGSTLWFPFAPELVPNQTVQAIQSFGDCPGIADGVSKDYTVSEGPILASPVIAGPVCATTTHVLLAQLTPGATVEIYIDNKPSGGILLQVPPTSTTAMCELPDLASGQLIRARQRVCGVTGPYSKAHTVLPALQVGQNGPVKPAAPLFAGASVIRYIGLENCTWIQLFSKAFGMIGEGAPSGGSVDVAIAPSLLEGDDITPLVIGCGGGQFATVPVKVQKPPPIMPPVVVAPCDVAYEVIVTGVIPGAMVWLFQNDQLAHTAQLAVTDMVKFAVATPKLAGATSFRAIQFFNGKVSETSAPVEATQSDGRWRINVANSQILAVHAALLPSGLVLYFGGDQHFQGAGDNLDNSRLYDFTNHQIAKVVYKEELLDACNLAKLTGTSKVMGQKNGANVSVSIKLATKPDLFCSGHAMLPSGDLLVSGGTSLWSPGEGPEAGYHEGHFYGARWSLVFKWEESRWLLGPAMNGFDIAKFGACSGKASNLSAATVEIDKAQISYATAAAHPELTGGRWYPTLLTLPSGKVFAVSGHPLPLDPRHNNNEIEVVDPAQSPMKWAVIGGQPSKAIDCSGGRQFDYPRLHVLPNGTIFCSTRQAPSLASPSSTGPMIWADLADQNDWIVIAGLAPYANGAEVNPGGPAPWSQRYQSLTYPVSTCMLPLHDGIALPDLAIARFLLFGCRQVYLLAVKPGGNNQPPDVGVVELARTLHAPKDPPKIAPERSHANQVILPTGQILCVGGVQAQGDNNTAVRTCELLTPAAAVVHGEPAPIDTIVPLSLAANTKLAAARNYHSVALLLPSGAVWVAGSSLNADPGPPASFAEKQIDIFEPWYFCLPRPKIIDFPIRLVIPKLGGGARRTGPENASNELDSFEFTVRHGRPITRISLVRLGSVTHAFNSDQRCILLPIVSQAHEFYRGIGPTSANVTIPGWYLAFVLDDYGVPSLGVAVQVVVDA